MSYLRTRGLGLGAAAAPVMPDALQAAIAREFATFSSALTTAMNSARARGVNAGHIQTVFNIQIGNNALMLRAIAGDRTALQRARTNATNAVNLLEPEGVTGLDVLTDVAARFYSLDTQVGQWLAAAARSTSTVVRDVVKDVAEGAKPVLDAGTSAIKSLAVLAVCGLVGYGLFMRGGK